MLCILSLPSMVELRSVLYCMITPPPSPPPPPPPKKKKKKKKRKEKKNHPPIHPRPSQCKTCNGDHDIHLSKFQMCWALSPRAHRLCLFVKLPITSPGWQHLMWYHTLFTFAISVQRRNCSYDENKIATAELGEKCAPTFLRFRRLCWTKSTESFRQSQGLFDATPKLNCTTLLGKQVFYSLCVS